MYNCGSDTIPHLGEYVKILSGKKAIKYLQELDLSQLKPEDVVIAYRLIEQLGEYEPDQWRTRFSADLCRLFQAELGVSYVMKFALDPGDIGPKLLIMQWSAPNKKWEQHIKQGDLRSDPATPFIMERFGTDFTCTRQEWIDDQTWYESEHVKSMTLGCGLDHAIYSQVGIIKPGVVDGIGLLRPIGGSPFSPPETALLRFIHQELARLWRKHDPLEMDTLPPRQREVLQGIRRGESRKAIAEKMSVSDHTVHTYEKALFDRSRVTSRTELQAVLSKSVRPTLLP